MLPCSSFAKKAARLVVLLTAAVLPAIAFAQDAPAEAVEAAADAAAALDKADTAWIMTSTVLVFLMVLPAIALFYGGLVRTKNMLSVLTQVLAIACVIGVIYPLWGYSMSFTNGGSLDSFVGGFEKAFLAGITLDTLNGTIPEFVWVSFQMTFAMITACLVIGGFAERVKFSAILAFIILWATFIYFPMAHMVWGDGLLQSWGVWDFAGGTVVHINSGLTGLIGAIIIGRRIGYGNDPMAPHSLTMTMIGASLLWIGWFGFNAGSALASNGLAGLARINTFVATAAGGASWMFAEWSFKGKPSLLGLASGVVAGLVAVTPAAGFAGPMGSLILGLVVGPVCMVFCSTVKNALKYDDSLDVFGIHCVGGTVGSLATGILIAPSLGGTGFDGFESIGATFCNQALGVVVALLYCGIAAAILYKLVDLIIGLRVTADEERQGLDITSHGERAYNY
ncbi:MAG: ammonium transporter [Methylobacteriaceae bacterium]|jgi:Amt family ammonium transporter|nr:ammonium transporter [Methylobacteriaceae bacterium]